MESGHAPSGSSHTEPGKSRHEEDRTESSRHHRSRHPDHKDRDSERSTRSSRDVTHDRRHHHSRDDDRHERHSHRSHHGRSEHRTDRSSHHPSSRDKRSRDDERSSRSSHRSSRDHRHHSSRRSSSPDTSSSKRRRHGHGADASSDDATRIVDDDESQVATGTALSQLNEDPATGSSSAENAAAVIPTSEALQLKSHPQPTYSKDPVPLPASAPTATALKRDEWMLTQPQASSDSVGAIMGSSQGRSSNADLRADGVRDEVDLERRGGEPLSESQTPKSSKDSNDFFSNLGQERIKAPRESKPNPEQLQVSSRELNTQFAEGKHIDNYAAKPARKLEFGSPGYQWRMMKLRKTYEQAEEQNRPVEEVAIERYGDESAFLEAKEEREWLDRNNGSLPRSSMQRQNSARNIPPQQSKAFMFTDAASAPGSPASRPISRQSFRRPGEASTPSTPGVAATPALSRLNSEQSNGLPSSSKPATPIPSVFTPQIPSSSSAKKDAPTSNDVLQDAVEASQARDSVTNPPMDAEALNKLEAKVLKAEMMGKSNAASLREKLDKEKARATKGGDQGDGYFDQKGSVQPGGPNGGASTDVQVLPTLDGRGRLYDVGTSKASATPSALPPGNRRKKEKFETHDPKTGEFMRYNADDDDITLEEMVREEKFQAGSGVSKNYDMELAHRIANDGAFKGDFDYLDENAERLARKKMRSDALKRQFAINDFAKTKKALESCRFCFQNEGESPPLARVVASGTRAYLAVPEFEPLVEGHCLIVPIQHNLTTLEAEDDTWDEIKVSPRTMLNYRSDVHTKLTNLNPPRLHAELHEVSSTTSRSKRPRIRLLRNSHFVEAPASHIH